MKTRRNLLLLSLVLGTLLVPSAGHASSTLTRTVSFEYDAASGLLTKEIIEPDNAALCLVTDHAYDAYGNKTTSTTRNCISPAPAGDAVFEARTSKNTYDARGQFPITSTNALNQSETKTFDARFGGITKLTGPNGLSTPGSTTALAARAWKPVPTAPGHGGNTCTAPVCMAAPQRAPPSVGPLASG